MRVIFTLALLSSLSTSYANGNSLYQCNTHSRAEECAPFFSGRADGCLNLVDLGLGTTTNTVKLHWDNDHGSHHRDHYIGDVDGQGYFYSTFKCGPESHDGTCHTWTRNNELRVDLGSGFRRVRLTVRGAEFLLSCVPRGHPG